MADRYTTGTQPLDRELDGGFRPGTVVTYVAEPQVQAETLLFQLAAQRRTHYVTTVTPPEKVRDVVTSMGGADDDLTVGTFDPADEVTGVADRLDVPSNAYLVVDAVDALERADPAAYHDFLADLSDVCAARDTVGVLHGIEGEQVPRTRDWTYRAADVVLTLDVAYEGIEPETLLRIEKRRGEDPPDEALKVQLGNRIRIDTSWDM